MLILIMNNQMHITPNILLHKRPINIMIKLKEK